MNVDPFIQRILDRLAKRISELELDKAYLETRTELLQVRIDELSKKLNGFESHDDEDLDPPPEDDPLVLA